MIKFCKLLFVLIFLIFNGLILRGQIKLDLVKAGVSLGSYIDNDSVQSKNGWGIYTTYEHYWANHFSTNLSISTFKTELQKYSVKAKSSLPIKDLMGTLAVDMRYYIFRLDNSPYIGAGLGAHICDCFKYNNTGIGVKGIERVREGAGGFDFRIKGGYQVIVNEKWAINLMGEYAFVRPWRKNYLGQYIGVLQIGYVLD